MWDLVCPRPPNSVVICRVIIQGRCMMVFAADGVYWLDGDCVELDSKSLILCIHLCKSWHDVYGI
jgi:hypothetical protein